jgi:hypothetical protein
MRYLLPALALITAYGYATYQHIKCDIDLSTFLAGILLTASFGILSSWRAVRSAEAKRLSPVSSATAQDRITSMNGSLAPTARANV